MVGTPGAGGDVSNTLTIAVPSFEGTEYGTFSDTWVAFWRRNLRSSCHLFLTRLMLELWSVSVSRSISQVYSL